MLLESGADPYIGCPGPVGYITVRQRRVVDDELWPPDEVFAKAFVSDPLTASELQNFNNPDQIYVDPNLRESKGRNLVRTASHSKGHGTSDYG